MQIIGYTSYICKVCDGYRELIPVKELPKNHSLEPLYREHSDKQCIMELVKRIQVLESK